MNFANVSSNTTSHNMPWRSCKNGSVAGLDIPTAALILISLYTLRTAIELNKSYIYSYEETMDPPKDEILPAYFRMKILQYLLM